MQYTPIFSPLLPGSAPLKIISAPHVTSESGTGLVHCAPAHGAEDYQAFLALGLISSANNMVCHVDKEGKFTTDVMEVVGKRAESLIGQEVLIGGSKAVVDLLQSIGALVKIQRIKHRYPYDWKTNKPIIVTCAQFNQFFSMKYTQRTLVRLLNGSQI
jgi:isoleucyl-tRNA synthetase